MTLFTLVIFVTSIWSLAFHAGQSLREDMKHLLSDQQFSTASIVAAEINYEMRDRLRALETMAKNVTPALLRQPVALQAILDKRSLLEVLFNGGAFVTRLDGMAVASVPLSAGRSGVNFMDRDYVVGAIKEGKGTIGKPLMGLFIKSPLFAMAVPIRDVQGKVIGALIGVVDLGHANFLDRVVEKSYGNSGGYLIVAPQHRLIVTATDRRRIMAPAATSGADSLVARFNAGYEGSGILVNPLGEEMLSSAKAIPVAGWYLVTNLPVAEAFAPIRVMQRRVLLAAILLTMLAGGLTWWMLRRQLAPMLKAAKTLARIHDTNQSLHTLPVTQQDEVGDLIGGFNRLIEILRERESRFQDIANASADWIWEINIDGRYTYVSDSVEGLLGYDATEIIGKTPFDLMPPGEAERVLAIFNAIVAQRQSFRDLDNINRHKDGSLRHVQTNGVPIFARDGEFVGYRGLDRDITERKQAEVALNVSEARLRLAMDATQQGWFDLNIQTGEVVASASFVRMVGGDPANYSMSHKIWIESIHRDDRAYMLRNFEKCLRTGEAQHMEYRMITRSGEWKWIQSAGKVVATDATGSPLRMTGTHTDITERKRLEEMHLQAQKLESLGTLAGGIAHDFNNILAAIRGNADLAAEDVGPNHLAAECLEEIKKASTRAHELVRRIMAFGRPRESGQEVVDLSAVVEEVLKLLRSTLPAGLVLKKDFAKDTPHVLADAGQIHEIIVNLTTNAAYAIGQRAGSIEYRLEPVQVGEKLALSVAGLKPGRYVRLTVTDSGCGMGAAMLERIFDAFYTTKPAGQGTGLGLSMVHGIMKSHSGAVTVESTPGKGTSFALYFPASRETANEESESVPAQSLLSTGQRVLYVDDEEALVFLANRVLSRLGHSISGFTDPKEALAAFRAHPQDYDIVVTDLSMPHMSGFDLAREMLALRPEMPVLMTSGYVRAEDEATAREIGIRELVLKPITVDELGRVLDRLFRASEPDVAPRE